MNISSGGPHILLFERDQQLATLLTSELQLAGYTNHIARTAVEVFDAIARYPVKLVLVNLAQAAAARREFWVALDSQRRDRKVQVLTFLCTNLAGYGSREYEDQVQGTLPDMEIDGMLGLMSLVDAIRTRVPGNSTTMPHLPRVSGENPSSTTAARLEAIPKTLSSGNGTTFRASQLNNSTTNPHIKQVQVPPKPSSPSLYTAPIHTTQPTNQPTTSPTTGLTGSSSFQPSYSEKIRAVLYPNQRPWNTQNNDTPTSTQGSQETAAPLYTAQNQQQPPQHTMPNNTTTPAYEDNVLQRMASGQLSNNTAGESGLAQLSRMAQGFRAPAAAPLQEGSPTARREDERLTRSNAFSATARSFQAAQADQATAAANNPWAIPAGASYASLETNETEETLPHVTQVSPAQVSPVQLQPQPTFNPAIKTIFVPTNQPSKTLHAVNDIPYSTLERTQLSPQQEQSSQARAAATEAPQTPSMATYSTYNGQSLSPTDDVNVQAQTLRASPIQDMPIERTITSPAITDSGKRLAHGQQATTYTSTQHQQATQTPNTSPLASIVTPMPEVLPEQQQSSVTTQSEQTVQKNEAAQTYMPTPDMPQPGEQQAINRQAEQQEAIDYIREQTRQAQNRFNQEARASQQEDEITEGVEESMTTNNAVLLDIVQSLPPMPTLAKQQSQQSVQPQVLSGRATRSLNKVLLDGHLVPQDRLEVAQNIQRMLRGVDLNYQLGEILLMFKLLSPDQLLAASLVSYGLIKTTQISALGRIRQELHAIGLEYDLENLLILFRILTPEQLREARSSLQS